MHSISSIHGSNEVCFLAEINIIYYLGDFRFCCKGSLWNKLKLNADKTHLITPVRVEMIILEENLDKSEDFLGISIEYNLKWHKTIDQCPVAGKIEK